MRVLFLLGLLCAGCAQPQQEPETTPLPDPVRMVSTEWSLARLTPEIDRFMAGREGTAGVAVRLRHGDRSFTWNGGTRFQLGSVIKVAVLAAYLQQSGAQLSPFDHDRLERMIVASDNDAAQEVWNEIGGHVTIEPWLQSLGLNETTADPREMWGESYASPGDLAELLAQIVWGSLLNPAQRRYALGLLTHVNDDQRWGISAGSRGITGLKNGWHEDEEGQWWVHSAGFMLAPYAAYTVAIFTAQQPTQEYGIETVEGISALVHRTLAH